jgi:hypothetical protein
MAGNVAGNDISVVAGIVAFSQGGRVYDNNVSELYTSIMPYTDVVLGRIIGVCTGDSFTQGNVFRFDPNEPAREIGFRWGHGSMEPSSLLLPSNTTFAIVPTPGLPNEINESPADDPADTAPGDEPSENDSEYLTNEESTENSSDEATNDYSTAGSTTGTDSTDNSMPGENASSTETNGSDNSSPGSSGNGSDHGTGGTPNNGTDIGTGGTGQVTDPSTENPMYPYYPTYPTDPAVKPTDDDDEYDQKENDENGDSGSEPSQKPTPGSDAATNPTLPNNSAPSSPEEDEQ